MDSPHPQRAKQNTVATCGQQYIDYRDNRFVYDYVTLPLKHFSFEYQPHTFIPQPAKHVNVLRLVQNVNKLSYFVYFNGLS